MFPQKRTPLFAFRAHFSVVADFCDVDPDGQSDDDHSMTCFAIASSRHCQQPDDLHIWPSNTSEFHLRRLDVFQIVV